MLLTTVAYLKDSCFHEINIKIYQSTFEIYDDFFCQSNFSVDTQKSWNFMKLFPDKSVLIII